MHLEPDQASTLLSDLLPPELWEISIWCLTHPVWGNLIQQPKQTKPGGLQEEPRSRVSNKYSEDVDHGDPRPHAEQQGHKTYKKLAIIGEGNGTPLQYLENPLDGGAWWAAVHGVARSRTRLSGFPFTFHFHALEKEMATNSSVFAWRIPGTAEPGGLPSMRSHRVGHDWSDLASKQAIAIIPPTIFSFLLCTGYSSRCFIDVKLINAHKNPTR